jgi:sporulation protein YlmC with PRC-barrel domain
MLRTAVYFLGSLLLASFLMLPATALVTGAEDSPRKAAREKSIEGTVVRASSVAGMSVKSPADKDLGKVEDLVIDMETGSVRYAVISFGGFPGFGDKLFAVPFRALHVKHEPGSKSAHFALDVSKQTLDQARGFDKKDWPTFADPRFAEENDRFFVEAEILKEKP